jgi:hypothetical protein
MNEPITGKKNFSFDLKEILAAICFLVSIGISIGAALKTLSEVDDLTKTVDIVKGDVSFIKGQNSVIISNFNGSKKPN